MGNLLGRKDSCRHAFTESREGYVKAILEMSQCMWVLLSSLVRSEKDRRFSRKIPVFILEVFRRQVGQLIFAQPGKLVVEESSGTAVIQMRLRDHVIC
jgi:hypothetical protein